MEKRKLAQIIISVSSVLALVFTGGVGYFLVRYWLDIGKAPYENLHVAAYLIFPVIIFSTVNVLLVWFGRKLISNKFKLINFVPLMLSVFCITYVLIKAPL